MKGPERKPWQLSEVRKEGKDQDNVEVLGTKPMAEKTQFANVEANQK